MRPVIVPGEESFGYGAICAPDVQNLIIRDNIITDFGVAPGSEGCGIFVLHGAMVEISRNQIRETRDLSVSPATSFNSFGGMRAGILALLVTPPTLDDSASTTPPNPAFRQNEPIYAPGLPALRIQENVVRVALGLALGVFGIGPFELASNHFSSGGRVSVSSDTQQPSDVTTRQAGPSLTTVGGALTIVIVNLGLAIEDVNPGDAFRQMYTARSVDFEREAGLANSSNGGVLFTNNVCQLEARVSGVQGLTSVGIVSLDHVLFANNQLWLDGSASPKLTALLDAFIFGFSIQVCANRFQESQKYPVLYSGLTVGIVNITAQNFSTYCLMAKALLSGYLVDQYNLVGYNKLCTDSRGNHTSQATTTE
jgi:hypothetical protein